MSGPPPRQNQGVYIPPRRNVPTRISRGSSAASLNVICNGPTTTGPPAPGDVNRAQTLPTSAGVQIAPRVASSMQSSVSIPSRGASAHPLPERTPSNPLVPPRGTYHVQQHQPQQQQPPPGQSRRLTMTMHQQYPPHPTLQMPLPMPPLHMPSPELYTQAAFPSPPHLTQQPSPQPSPHEYPYIPPTHAFPAPEIPPPPPDDLRRPLSFHASDPPEVYIPPRRETRRYSFSETSSLSSVDEDSPSTGSGRFSRTGSEIFPPVIPPRSSGFMIPMRNTSVQKPNIDTLLDEGGMAFGAPRHNVEEALAKWRQARELAVKEKDLLREAKALSNIGCALRAQGRLEESLDELREAWNVTTQYVAESAWKSNSMWLQLVMRHTDIDADMDVEEPSSSANNAANREQGHMDPSQGPPIVVWFLQLTTNLGNAFFCLKQFQEAIHYHDVCKRLAEAVLEDYPLPPSFNAANVSRTLSTHSLESAETDEEARRISLDNGPSTKTKIKLSYLHRQTLLAQSRSLTHLGLCYQQLGLDDEALSTHRQAENIVTFYSARLQASTSTRRASLSNPQAIPMEVNAAQAAIVANVGTSYHAKGQLPNAIHCHQKANKLFRDVHDRVGRSKQDANLAALNLEVGKALNTLQWLRNTGTSTKDAGGVNIAECRRYWGPPRLEMLNMGTGALDETSPEIIGQPLFDQGILNLYESERIFRAEKDMTSLSIVWVNLAAGYILLHQPYLALHYLSRLVPEGLSPAFEANAIPPFIAPHVHITICQALFLLIRLMQENPSRPLFPPATSEGPLDHGTGLPVIDPVPINRLLKTAGMGDVDVSRLTIRTLLDLFRQSKAALNDYIKERSQNAAAMYTYLEGNLGNTSGDSVLVKSEVLSLSIGKLGWVGSGDASVISECLDEGRSALVKCVHELGVGAVKGFLGILSISSSAFMPLDSRYYDVVEELLETLRKCQENGEDGLVSMATLGPAVLPLMIDLMCYAEHQRAQSNAPPAINVPSTPSVPEIIERLSVAARKILGGTIGVCSECLDEFVDSLVQGIEMADEEGSSLEVVFCGVGANRREPTLRERVYPCEHFTWRF
ncbi:hypothetical protein HDU85_002086 [Gaertneriomyces sp. JEL0708]|nr:hypothetical protein HDU85_002086 [Gaertneriomyces sp. JEL0708]